MVPRKKLFWQICCQILLQNLVILCTFLVSGAGKPQIIIFCNLWFLISCLTLSKNRKSQFTNLWYFWLSGIRYKKVYKITNFCDKIWQQICQKSFFLSVTCWTLNLISEVILDQKTYVSVLLIFEPNQLPLQHQATILVFFSMIPFNFEKCEWFCHELVIKSNQMTSEYKWMQPDATSCAV